ncbi:hypothetical protein B7494_g6708 [Chlorociboria aeruginascens]|nr:hypothetical protein B7494_g6708 [Chlorociboria aeruginascens]
MNRGGDRRCHEPFRMGLVGSGPPLIIFLRDDCEGRSGETAETSVDPEPMQKWAEEGFCVLEIRTNKRHLEWDANVVEKAFDVMKLDPQCRFQGKIGIIFYSIYHSLILDEAKESLAQIKDGYKMAAKLRDENSGSSRQNFEIDIREVDIRAETNKELERRMGISKVDSKSTNTEINVVIDHCH